MPHGIEVGLGSDHIAVDVDPAPPSKNGAHPAIFGPCLLWPNGWMDQDSTWHVGRPRPRPHCARWGPSSPPPKRGHSPPIFGSCLLWPNGRPSQLLLNTCSLRTWKLLRIIIKSSSYPNPIGSSGRVLESWYRGDVPLRSEMLRGEGVSRSPQFHRDSCSHAGL